MPDVEQTKDKVLEAVERELENHQRGAHGAYAAVVKTLAQSWALLATPTNPPAE